MIAFVTAWLIAGVLIGSVASFMDAWRLEGMAALQDAAIAASWRAAMPSRRQASMKDATEPISTPAISQAVTNAIMLILSLRCGRSAPQAAMDIRPMGRSALTDQGLSEADIYISLIE